MSECVRRGFVPTDARDFQGASLCLLQKAQTDVAYLLDRGYDVERATTFVGDRFQFSSRQRMALIRATSSHHDVMLRQEKLFSGPLQGKTLWIDGFNTIIPLEAALSGSTVLLCMDGSARDLCGLHGSYRLIDKTDSAISLLLEAEPTPRGACPGAKPSVRASVGSQCRCSFVGQGLRCHWGRNHPQPLPRLGESVPYDHRNRPAGFHLY